VLLADIYMPPWVLHADREHHPRQRRARALLSAKGLVYEELDGADQSNIEARNALFGLSGQRGKYPQFFIERPDGTKAFVGLWEAVEVSEWHVPGRGQLFAS
jgi:hypothetical protein